jgi:hypothetical protein
MTIIEAWQNRNGDRFAIARDERGGVVALWGFDRHIVELIDNPGFDVASFSNADQAKAFLMSMFPSSPGDPQHHLKLVDSTPKA